MGKIIFKPCTGKSFTSLWQRSGTWEACLQNPHVMLMRGHAWRHVLSGMVLKFLQAPGRSSFHVLLPCREAFKLDVLHLQPMFQNGAYFILRSRMPISLGLAAQDLQGVQGGEAWSRQQTFCSDKRVACAVNRKY